jgi:glycosyltransferase involved in cell wall biosynthesis
MNILYLSQYFPPEIGATQSRAYEMASNLVAFGHRVTVMTEMPNHPSGIIPPEYRGRFRAVEEMDGIKVIRSWVFASPIKNFKQRMLFYLSFMGTSVLNSLFLRTSGFDLVYATSPPLFVGLAGLIIAKLRKLPFVLEVRDLWPESAVELGFLTNPRSARWANRMADYCYRNALSIICVTKGIQKTLLGKNIPGKKIFLIRNGTNPERFRHVFDAELQKRLGWLNKFVALYAGVHGVAQGLETVLEAASLLVEEAAIRFVFIGEGPCKEDLQRSAIKMKLRNVDFLPQVATNEIAKYISLAGVCLVPLRKRELFKGALPSKIFDSWACGKPVILGIEGEARSEMEEAQGGIFVEPENPQEMARAIMDIYGNPERARQMGENGKEYLHKKGLFRSEQARQLEEILQKLLQRNSNLPSEGDISDDL